MTDYWELGDELLALQESGEDLPDDQVDRLVTLRERTAEDLFKISNREVGEISELTEYLAISFTTDDPEVRDDAGLAGYLMLDDACGLPPE